VSDSQDETAKLSNTNELLQLCIDTLTPVAEAGNAYAVLWLGRLRIAQAPLFKEEYREREIKEFTASIKSMFDAVLAFRDALIGFGIWRHDGGNTPTEGG
jgi:hypothetical protein